MTSTFGFQDSLLRIEGLLSNDDRMRLHRLIGDDVPGHLPGNSWDDGALYVIDNLSERPYLSEQDCDDLIEAFKNLNCSDACQRLLKYKRTLQDHNAPRLSLKVILADMKESDLERDPIVDPASCSVLLGEQDETVHKLLPAGIVNQTRKPATASSRKNGICERSACIGMTVVIGSLLLLSAAVWLVEHRFKRHRLSSLEIPPHHLRTSDTENANKEKSTSLNSTEVVTLNEHAKESRRVGNYSTALHFYERLLAIQNKTLPRDDREIATSYDNIGQMHTQLRDFEQARKSLEKSIELRRTNLSFNDSDLARSYGNLGIVHAEMGNYSEALEFHEKSLEIQKQSRPSDYPVLASSYNNIGLLYSRLGEHSKALEFLNESLKIREETLPPDQPSLASAYRNIGTVYGNMGEHSQALKFYMKSLEIWKSLSINDPDLATLYGIIGGIHTNIGDDSEAARFYAEADAVVSNISSPISS